MTDSGSWREHVAGPVARRHRIGGVAVLALAVLACGGDGTGPGAVGTLQVIVEGLPTDVPADVKVTGPGGFSRTLSATEQLSQLAFGTYTIDASGVESARSRWRVTPETRQVTLSAGSRGVTQRVTYEVATGALLLQVVGLPPGAAADLELRPPSGAAQLLTATTTLEKLPPGRYVVESRAVRAGGHAWVTPVSLQSIDLTPRVQPLLVQVAYTVGSATLAVELEQLPPGTTAQVEVRGPGGFVRQLTRSDSLVGIEPGAYTLTAAAVTKDGERYDAAAPIRQLTLLPSTTALVVRFVYGRSSARLTVDVLGLPAGTPGSVFVRGPGGFAQTLATTGRMVGLPTGTYVVSASTVVTSGGSFSATPLEQTVDLSTAGSEAAVQVAYVRVTGSLSIGVAGLPAGALASITVSGPNGFSEFVTAARVLDNLVPGTYTVSAAAITASGTLHAPAPPLQLVAVAAGASPGVQVTYAPAVGALAVTVTGLPPGANAAVTVLGTGGPYAVTSSTVLGPLQPGAYTVNASAVQVGGTIYTAQPATQVATVTTSPVPASVTITYGVTVGSLAVQVGGLPPGTAASVQVTGPGGFAQLLTASTTLTGLAPGSYTLTAAPVSVGGTLYAVTPSSQAVTVVAGVPAQLSMTYAPVAAGLNLTIESAYIVQAVQDRAGTVPLVAGRDGVVRVFVRASATNTAQPQVRVRIYSGSTVVQALTIAAPSASVPTAVSESPLPSSWNATVSGAFLQPGYRLLADVDPSGQVAEAIESDNSFPASGTPLALDVRSTSAFQVRFVPVHISANGLTGNVSAGNVQQFLGLTRKVWPVQQVEADVRVPYTTNAPPLQSNDGNGAWGQILGELNVLRTADGSARYYMGVVRTTYTSGVAGLGYVPGRAAMTWDFQPSADEVTAHELGHNFSRLHAPCGGPSGVDPNYPYQGAAIGVYGLDVALGALKVPSQPDIMSYCSPVWVSDYNWRAVLNYRASNPGARVVGAMGAAPRGRSLLVWGRVNGQGLVLEPSFTLESVPAALPQGRGTARVEVLDGTGRVLYASAFEPEAVADGRDPAERHFTFAIPLADAALQAMQVVRVTSAGRQVERRSGTAATGRQREVPRLVRSGRRAGEVRVEWSDRSVQGVLVRDGTSGEILALLRDRPGYSASGSGEVELLVSDGVRSTPYRRQAPR